MKHTNQTIFVIVLLVLISGAVSAQDTDSQASDQQETRQAQAVSRSVYDVIEKAQALIEAEDWAGSNALLIALVDKGGLSDYEAANVYRYIGFSYHSLDDTSAAIEWFGKVLNIAGLEEQTRKTTLYTMAQLLMISERYDDALAHLERWFLLESNPPPGAHFFHAQVLYQLGRHAEMIAPIEAAIAVAKERNIEVKEEWYTLLSFAFYQQENYEKVRDINTLLILNWPKKRYWLALANAYRELNDDAKLLVAYELAHMQGFLSSDAELVTMAQLYLQADVPYVAGELLEREMQSGRVGKTASNYRLLSQAWMLAREDSRAIPPLKIAAELDDSGDLFIRLASAHLNMGDSENCVKAAKAGIAKGNLKNRDYAQMTLGTCFYNQQAYVEALRMFYIAADTPRSVSRANQWIKVTKLEISRIEAIQTAEANADQRFRELAVRRSIDDQS